MTVRGKNSILEQKIIFEKIYMRKKLDFKKNKTFENYEKNATIDKKMKK